MPNDVTNELVFRGVDSAGQEAIEAKLCVDGKVDFEVLVPTPLNVWRGNVSSAHEQAFGRERCGLDWSRVEWGTKWNAYSHKPIDRTADTITFVFNTAWRPPYPWLVAVFNSLKCDFDHNWLDGGASRGVEGRWRYSEMEKNVGDPWRETPCSDEMQRHLHKLRWGVEEFPDARELGFRHSDAGKVLDVQSSVLDALLYDDPA